jgi:hypothetical protein
MMNNNKILTVSYGTFSCTLEGFDDSFGTMKAIAEYFRDLASDDRYFGAEPPQPDVEMLSRIAQKDISRRVKVREQDGKIVLSATDDAQQADAPVLAAPEVNLKAEAMIAAEAARAAQAQLEKQAQAEEQAEIARVQAEADAKAVADAEAARLEEARLEEARQDAELIDAERAQAEAKALSETPAPVVPRDLAGELPEAEAFFASNTADNAADEVEITAPVAETVITQAPLDDSIAAKLQRIRAVVSNADHASDDDDFSEDQHAEDFGADITAELTETTTDVEDFDITDFSVDTTDEIQVKVAVQADAIADIQAASQADDVADASDTQNDMNDDDMSAILARLDVGDDADEAEDIAEIVITSDAEDDASLEDDLEESTSPARIARVIKVKRADLEAAIAQGDLEEVDDEDDIQDSTLSDEDEAELARDLADVEADLENLENESLFEDATFDDETATAPQALPAIGDNDDDDALSRLLAEADQQMNDEEGKQSRDAFLHLRAAVAVKKADAGLAEPTTEEEEVAYRSDLATAVKPRRPAAGAGRSERPTPTERPAPLKLVAEQRVDTAEMDTRGTVRPRRVTLQEAAVNIGTDSFVEFAEDMGAHELPDLLEAAAAYMSFVEGREQFSRPQLMNKVRSVEKENFSREDGLRSFGKLLRAGKIEKIKGGRFAVTNDIGYRPDARAAG